MLFCYLKQFLINFSEEDVFVQFRKFPETSDLADDVTRQTFDVINVVGIQVPVMKIYMYAIRNTISCSIMF